MVPSAELPDSGIDRELLLYPLASERERMEDAFARMYFEVIEERVATNPYVDSADIENFAVRFDRNVQRAMVAHQILTIKQPILYGELANSAGGAAVALQSTLALFLCSIPDYRLGFAASDGDEFETGSLNAVQYLRYWLKFDRSRQNKSDIAALELAGKVRSAAREALASCGISSNPFFSNSNISERLASTLGLQIDVGDLDIEDSRTFLLGIKVAIEAVSDPRAAEVLKDVSELLANL